MYEKMGKRTDEQLDISEYDKQVQLPFHMKGLHPGTLKIAVLPMLVAFA
jgi:hypothetical protein